MRLNENTVKSLKRVFAIVVPALVMVITIIMVSISFAWFSDDVKPSVQSIKLTVGKVFSLSFDSTSNGDNRNLNFGGQDAIDSLGRLITTYNSTHDRPGGISEELYLLDMPFFFVTTVELDTESTDIKLSMELDLVKISKRVQGSETDEKRVIVSYDTKTVAGDNVLNFEPDKVPYAFTWYFKEHVASEEEKNDPSKPITEPTNYYKDADDKALMKKPFPSDGEVWYTPYGKVTFGVDGAISEVNGRVVTDAERDSFSLLDIAPADREMLLNTKDNTKYDFYIIFAPQKLFWAQFSPNDRALLVTANGDKGGLYSADEAMQYIYNTTTLDGKKQMYYSNTAYNESIFEFGATLKVSEIGERPEQEQTIG